MVAYNNPQRFADRIAAGRALASRLVAEGVPADPIVLALPRGGVPVAFEVALALAAPLDVLIVRKLGTPGQPELAMGAIAEGGVQVLNAEVVRAIGLRPDMIGIIAAREQQEIARRARRYRGNRPPPALRGRTVFLIDDGLATGATMRAAIAAVRSQHPARLIVAVPVAAWETVVTLRPTVDQLVALIIPGELGAIGCWYADFAQTSDEEVCGLLQRAAALAARRATPA